MVTALKRPFRQGTNGNVRKLSDEILNLQEIQTR